MTEKLLTQDWTIQPERGALPLVRLGVWIALRLGRRLSRLFLYPICLYFLLSSATAARASQHYLARALGRRAKLGDVFRHFRSFAACLLDRVYLLNEQTERFAITVHGQQIMREIEAQGGGCILFGAHLGSFEVVRAVGRKHSRVPVSLLMYEENARKIRAALGAINPRLEDEVIGLGRMDSLIAVAARLRRGHYVGVLADRNVDGRDMVALPFLGAPAAFPRGPFQVALLLRAPVVMMVGRYCGGNRYEVSFERLAEPCGERPGESAAWVDETMRRYVGRLEDHCRQAPYNWFNFYDFWQEAGADIGS